MLHLDRDTTHLLLGFIFEVQRSPRAGPRLRTFCSSICFTTSAWPCLQNSHDLGRHSFGDPCRKALLLRNSHCPSWLWTAARQRLAAATAPLAFFPMSVTRPDRAAPNPISMTSSNKKRFLLHLLSLSLQNFPGFSSPTWPGPCR